MLSVLLLVSLLWCEYDWLTYHLPTYPTDWFTRLPTYPPTYRLVHLSTNPSTYLPTYCFYLPTY